MLLAAAIGDSEAVRRDLELDAEQSPAARRIDLVPVAQRSRQSIPRRLPTPTWTPARALLVAACRFHRPALRAAGTPIGERDHERRGGLVPRSPVLTAGPWAVTPPITHQPQLLLASLVPGRCARRPAIPAGRALAASSVSITSALMSPPARLPPDWARLEGTRPVPIGSPSDPQTAPQFGFDAVRTLVRMAEDPEPAGRQIAARAWPVFAGAKPDQPARQPHAVRDARSATSCIRSCSWPRPGQPTPPDSLPRATGCSTRPQALDRRSPTYYGAAWVALGRIMLTTNLLDVACS